MRVLSSVLNVSSDREQVEKSANVAVIALAAAQRAASLARELNEFVMAREELLSNIRLANRIKAKVFFFFFFDEPKKIVSYVFYFRDRMNSKKRLMCLGQKLRL